MPDGLFNSKNRYGSPRLSFTCKKRNLQMKCIFIRLVLTQRKRQKWPILVTECPGKIMHLNCTRACVLVTWLGSFKCEYTQVNRGSKINPKCHKRLDYHIAIFKSKNILQNCFTKTQNNRVKNSVFKTIKGTWGKFVTHFLQTRNRNRRNKIVIASSKTKKIRC